MDSFDVLFVLFGLAGIAAGIYELVTRKLVNRKVEGVSEKKIQAFLPWDALTYIGEGVLLALSGLNRYVPFLNTVWAVILGMVLVIGLLALNMKKSRELLTNS